jgi:hypothetical protein
VRDWKSAASVVAVSVLVVGCGETGAERESVRVDRNRACFDQLGEPLKAGDVVAALAAEGFTAVSLPQSEYCDGAGVDTVGTVTNRPARTGTDASEEEGWIICEISRDTAFRDPDVELDELDVDLEVPPSSPAFGGTKARFVLANISCAHYPAGVARTGGRTVRTPR